MGLAAPSCPRAMAAASRCLHASKRIASLCTASAWPPQACSTHISLHYMSSCCSHIPHSQAHPPAPFLTSTHPPPLSSQLRGIVATFRMTKRAQPDRPSHYVSAILAPLQTFLSGETAGRLGPAARAHLTQVGDSMGYARVKAEPIPWLAACGLPHTEPHGLFIVWAVQGCGCGRGWDCRRRGVCS